MGVTISKSLVRKTILSYRKQMASSEFAFRNDLLCQRLKGMVEQRGFEVIHTFLPIGRNKEPDATVLFSWLWENGKTIVVSKTNFERRNMDHFILEEDTVLEENHVGIKEPVSAKAAAIEKVDLVLVPLVVADKLGNRVGYGGGFYDQLLAGTKALKVGLSLSSPLDEILQADEWDIPIDILITPFNTYQHG